MKLYINADHERFRRSPMIYGHFIEHFHRQIYGGVYDPGNPLSDADGFRTDVIEAMKKIHVPILRWPGGCFVSSYHWKDGVGRERVPYFDKAWRVEEPNTFGTDEYIRMCRLIGCEPYICTNAGTGSEEEMSDWVEYCNLKTEGRFARQRIENGSREPYAVKYWSIGNENYGSWEIGAKSSQQWARFCTEAAKMMKHVDPKIELSAAALTDLDWNISLLKACGPFLDWISIHEYWDPVHETNDLADYEGCMAFTEDIGHSVRKVRGLLEAMGLEKQIKIAFDEWNLRGWYHPGVHGKQQAENSEEYITPRNDNDINSQYTMGDAVFTACFLNMLNRNSDIVGMANFAPVINTRGCIFTYPEGIVKRSTYHVFDLYTNELGDIILDDYKAEGERGTFRNREGQMVETDLIDTVTTAFADRKGIAVAAVNKDPDHEQALIIDADISGQVTVRSICGDSKDAYNDIDHEGVTIEETSVGSYSRPMKIMLKPHSVNVIRIAPEQ